jgi:hypothetical protein
MSDWPMPGLTFCIERERSWQYRSNAEGALQNSALDGIDEVAVVGGSDEEEAALVSWLIV